MLLHSNVPNYYERRHPFFRAGTDSDIAISLIQLGICLKQMLGFKKVILLDFGQKTQFFNLFNRDTSQEKAPFTL